MLTETRLAAGLVLALSAWLPGLGEDHRALIDEIRSGRRTEARASWWGFSPIDSTTALQAAINSGARKLVIDDCGSPWIVDKITLASDQEIVLEKGVVVMAKPGAFRGRADALFSAALRRNITLVGYGATLRMRKRDYTTAAYEKAEWRHALSIRSCDNVKIYGLTLADSGGDGIYLGVAKRGVPCRNIHIKDVVCDNNHRQGVSVISAENLLIENTTLKNTSGTAPQAGIDFEPNTADERLVNCVMRNCVSENNAGGAFALYLVPLTGKSAPVSLRLEDCRGIGGAYGFSLTTSNGHADGLPSGSIDVINCTFTSPRGAGIAVTNVPASRMKVRFDHCKVIDAAVEQPALSPLMLGARHGATDPVGNVEFTDCTIRDPRRRQPLRYRDYAGDVPPAKITGALLCVRDTGTERIELTPTRLDEWIPSRRLRFIPRLTIDPPSLQPISPHPKPTRTTIAPIKQRRTVRYLLYASAGDAVALRFKFARIASYSGKSMPIRVQSPNGEGLADATIPFRKEAEIAFTAPATGVYTVAAEPGANCAIPISTTHPLCLAPVAGRIALHRFVGDLYFWVPPDAAEFGVRVHGEGGESVRAHLFHPDGRRAWSEDNIDEVRMFDTTEATGRLGGVWRLQLEKPSAAPFEDYAIDLRGLPPLLASSPKALFKPQKTPHRGTEDP